MRTLVSVRAHLALVVAISVAGISCAVFEPDRRKEQSAAFRTEPAAETPRIEVAWRQPVDAAEVWDYRPRQFAGPAMRRGDDRRDLVVGTDGGRVYRIRAGDGRIEWNRQVDGAVHATPSVTRRRVYAGTTAGALHAFDRSSGDEIWRRDHEYGVEGTPEVADGLVYYTTNAGRLLAVDESNGEEVWSYSRSTPKEFTVKGSGSPTLAGDLVVCGFDDGKLAALDARSGQEEWVADVAGGDIDFSDVDAPVIVRGDRVFATSYGGGVAAYSRESGRELWSRGFENVSAVAHGGGTLYAALATGRVVALELEKGRSKWGFRFEDNLPVEATVAGPYLFVATGSGPLYVLDRQTGYPLLRWRPSPGVNTEPVFSRRGGYMLSNKGYLYRFRLAY